MFQNATTLNHGDEIRHLLNVSADVRRKQDGTPFVFNHFGDFFEQFVTGYGIEPDVGSSRTRRSGSCDRASVSASFTLIPRERSFTRF